MRPVSHSHGLWDFGKWCWRGGVAVGYGGGLWDETVIVTDNSPPFGSALLKDIQLLLAVRHAVLDSVYGTE